MIIFGGGQSDTDGDHGNIKTWGRFIPGSSGPGNWACRADDNPSPPSQRARHTAVWTGNTGEPATANQMIIWGGNCTISDEPGDDGTCDEGEGDRDNGATFTPGDSWLINSLNVAPPSPRNQHTAVWDDTSGKMIVWGGNCTSIAGGSTCPVNAEGPRGEGGQYNPSGSGSWTLIPAGTLDSPTPRFGHTAVWTGGGGEMIVWGGRAGSNLFLDTGGRYDPSAQTWSATALSSFTPEARNRWPRFSTWSRATAASSAPEGRSDFAAGSIRLSLPHSLPPFTAARSTAVLVARGCGSRLPSHRLQRDR